MKGQSREAKEKEAVFGILRDRVRENAVTLDELCNFTGISKDRLRKIIHDLAMRDRIPITLKTEFPYGFYVKEQNI